MLLCYVKLHYHIHKGTPVDIILNHFNPVTLKSVVRGPFEKFIDSPYYSELELCGGAVTVSFSKYLHPLLEYMLQTICRKLEEDIGLGGFDLLITLRFIFHVLFSVSKALPSLENRSSSHCIVSIGLMDEL
jgi:hypothetical protein